MDKLSILGMEFHAYHGVHAEEARLGQRFLIDVELSCDAHAAGCSDDLSDAVNYGAVYKTVAAAVTEARYNLIEALAAAIAQAVLRNYPAVDEVLVRVSKPQAPIAGVFDTVQIEIRRRRAWLEKGQ